MVATADLSALSGDALTEAPLARADGVELLGAVQGTGYKRGAALVRRADGQMVQLSGLMYRLLECADGRRGVAELAPVLSEQLGRRVDVEHVVRLAEKLGETGLLAGTEHMAPARSNPLLALRWKMLVTNPKVTSRLTRPFTGLFRPWFMWPVVGAFAAVFWFVLIDKGVASATAQAFNQPGLLLLVFLLTVISAAFHELGHAAACRYGGATPGGMGMGLYLVWPAFYTDVTDAYRLRRRARLRVDLAGLYFNAVVAVATMAVWLVWRMDALLLLVALQILQMVKQLSPIIRADGYHILSDATGVPDMYAHLGPTIRRLLPGHRREPAALAGWARVLVTAWVLVFIPVMLSLMLGAVLLFPRLVTTAWDSGRNVALLLPGQTARGQVIDVVASVLKLVALLVPVVGSALVMQRVLRTTVIKARKWSSGSPGRRLALLVAAGGVVTGLAWAWWPAGQYQPVRAGQPGTLPALGKLLSSPGSVARPAPPSAVSISPGTHLAVAMIPVAGATKKDPALFVIAGVNGKPATALLSDATPGMPGAGGTTVKSLPASVFPFVLPSAPGPGGTQALAVNTKDGGVTYDVTYSLVTVTSGAPVTETNSAYALADCKGCTTVAVSFQVVLVVGQSNVVTPVNAAVALNYNCPACTTTAIADQIVVTLRSQPSTILVEELDAAMQKLNFLPELGSGGTPTAIASQVAAVQQQIDTELNQSGLVPDNTSTFTAVTSSTTTTVPPTAGGASGSGTGSPPLSSSGPSPSGVSSPSGSSSGYPSPYGQPASTTTTTPTSSSSTAASAGGTSSGTSGSSSTTTTSIP
ncbi:MAG TPA: hypothetical protein VG184_10435 [Acidimicrobiales bacterium]|jgi:putative peptide zinc metalloprotease protein|nr:hypothetical protein [Acidimicrobiales bacterium]